MAGDDWRFMGAILCMITKSVGSAIFSFPVPSIAVTSYLLMQLTVMRAWVG